jgi:hypothetical protein
MASVDAHTQHMKCAKNVTRRHSVNNIFGDKMINFSSQQRCRKWDNNKKGHKGELLLGGKPAVEKIASFFNARAQEFYLCVTRVPQFRGRPKI